MIQQMSGPDQVEQELQEEEPVTLTALPDLPLLRVLSHLSGKDLLAVGRVCTRLCELTRAHTSLWWGKRAGFGWGRKASFSSEESEELLLDLLQATPPVRLRLELDVDADLDERAGILRYNFDFSSFSDQLDEADIGNRARPLSLIISCSVNYSEYGASVIRKLGSRTRDLYLKCRRIRLDKLFDSLQNSTSLETLFVEWRYHCQVPPLKCLQALPKLHTVKIDIDPYISEFGFPDLRLVSQLLEAHGEQLRCVRLLTSEATPLLDACPSGLHRLSVVAEKGVLAKLERMRHLDELVFEAYPPPAPTELATLLRTWQGPPLRLAVRQCTEELVRALGAAVTPSVTHLELGGWRWGSIGASELRALPAALPALPALQSLVLFASELVPDVLREIATGPVLSLLFLNDVRTPELERDSFCRDLVLRNSMSLHAVNRSFNKDYSYKVILFGRHPEAGQELCSVCAEVRSIIELNHCTLRYVNCEQSD